MLNDLFLIKRSLGKLLHSCRQVVDMNHQEFAEHIRLPHLNIGHLERGMGTVDDLMDALLHTGLSAHQIAEGILDETRNLPVPYCYGCMAEESESESNLEDGSKAIDRGKAST